MRKRKRSRAPRRYAYLGSAARIKAARRRGFIRGIVLAGLAVGLAGAGYGISRLADWALKSDAFAIERTYVLGNREVREDAVLAAAGIDSGVNLLRISPREIERSVCSLPRVKRALVQRRFPDELLIRVAERKPCFLVNCGCVWLVDREGVVIGRAGALDLNRFTMATGLAPATGQAPEPGVASALREKAAPGGDALRLEPGVQLDTEVVPLILETISSLNKYAPDLPRMVSEICLMSDGGLALFTSDPPHRVLIGDRRPTAESLVALGPVLGDLKRRGLTGVEVDLRFERQLVVRATKEHVAMRGKS